MNNVSNFFISEKYGTIYFLNNNELCFYPITEDGYINLNQIKDKMSCVDRFILEDEEDLRKIKSFLLEMD